MEVIVDNPPIYDELLKHGMKPHVHVVYTYGSVLYNPSNDPISPDLMAHEELHSKQQGEDPRQWWDKYLADPKFRIDQEIKAYARQYQEICKTIEDRNQRAGILMRIAKALSGEIYGNIVTEAEAYQQVKKLSGVE